MSRIPHVTGADLIAALGRRGFSVLRIRGSHHFLRHEDGRVSLPIQETVLQWESLREGLSRGLSQRPWGSRAWAIEPGGCFAGMVQHSRRRGGGVHGGPILRQTVSHRRD